MPRHYTAVPLFHQCTTDASQPLAAKLRLANGFALADLLAAMDRTPPAHGVPAAIYAAAISEAADRFAAALSEEDDPHATHAPAKNTPDTPGDHVPMD